MCTCKEILLHKLHIYWIAKLVDAKSTMGFCFGDFIKAFVTAAPCCTWFKLPQT